MRLSSSRGIPMLDCAWAGSALDRADESGDIQVLVPFEDGVLAALIDGLGHGPEAAHAAREAEQILQAHAGAALTELFELCHAGLRKTRGVVMSLAAFNGRTSTVDWFGVGNVEAVLLRAGSAAPERLRGHEAIGLRGGVLGYRLPPLKIATAEIFAQDLWVMVTDGIKSDFAREIVPDWDPQAIADWLLSRYARGTDDALVLVARYLGGAP
jgi:phosphoserine phosphatase RsbX